jgi:hypothetical protein
VLGFAKSARLDDCSRQTRERVAVEQLDASTIVVEEYTNFL